MKIVGAEVYTEKHLFKLKDICMEGEYITDSSTDNEVIDAAGLYAIPGLVDIHLHGAMGNDFCDTDVNGLEKIAEYEARNGILAICPATMTYTEEKLGIVMDTAKTFASRQTRRKNAAEADLVGINMEGPFISPGKTGAQNPKYVTSPDVEMFRRLQERSGGLVRLLDIAPEVEGGFAFIDACHKEVNISLAHSCADYQTACNAFDRGAKHCTHLYNAMPGIHHREPGPVIAALEKNAEVEIITDGIHIHPAMVRFTFRIFQENKVILISDSMEAAGLPDGKYRLGGQDVTVQGRRAFLTRDPQTVAGSVTNLYDCMKTAVREMGVPLEQAVRAATENPARAIGVDDKYGSILTGKYANVLLIDNDMEIKHIICHGKII